MTTDLLAGITVLDFGTVGPAARASAILADYGAQVTKVGAVPRSGADTTASANIAANTSNHHGWCGKAPVTNGRARVRAQPGWPWNLKWPIKSAQG